MSSATFDSANSTASLVEMPEDPLLAYTYSSDENREDVHYLAIPVDALNTRSVTIQVFYDQSSGGPAKIMKLSADEQPRIFLDGATRAVATLAMDKKQPIYDPYMANSNDNEQFEGMNNVTQFHTDNDPMLLDSQLNASYMMADGEDQDCFGGKEIGDEKGDGMFFDDTILVETPADEYAQGDYQNAFTAAVDVRQVSNNNNSEQPSIPDYELEDSSTSLYPIKPPLTIRTHRCTECGKTFPSPRSLKYHSQIHAPAIYACAKCRKTFGSMLKLKRHALIHDTVRPFPCEFDGCHKSFTTKSNLNVHHRTHTGEKPYVCSVCNRAFSHQSHAKAHLKIHLKKLDANGPAPRISEQK